MSYFSAGLAMKEKTVIAITGGSGSGKTSVLHAIRSRFKPGQVCIISQDEYYQARTEQKADQHGYLNFDVPGALDLEAFEQDILKLIDDQSVRRPVYLFNNEVEVNEVLIYEPAPVLVVEGLFLYARPSLVKMIDYSIYMHAKEDLKLIRRIKRDINERNYTLEEILHRYQNHVMPAYATYIRHLRERVDLVINNNQDYLKGLEILTAFIAAKIPPDHTVSNELS